MGQFNGWLLKIGNIQLPNNFICSDGWKQTPNQRIDLDSYRDSSAEATLHREVADGFKTKISVQIRQLTVVEMGAFMDVLGLATLPASSKKERKVMATYWNDEELEYKTSYFYIPDFERSIHYISDDGTELIYNSFTFSLIEY